MTSGRTNRLERPEDALERVAWYTTRWLVEEYQQCLKTGCRVERRDLEHVDRVRRLLGFLSLVCEGPTGPT